MRRTSRPRAVEMTDTSHEHQFATSTYLPSGVALTTFGTAPTW